jgi:hypothetical protein
MTHNPSLMDVMYNSMVGLEKIREHALGQRTSLGTGVMLQAQIPFFLQHIRIRLRAITPSLLPRLMTVVTRWYLTVLVL